MSIEGFAHELMNSNELDAGSTLRDNGVDSSCDLVMLCHALEDIANVVVHHGEIGLDSSVSALRVLIETRRAANLRLMANPARHPASYSVPVFI